MLNPFIKCLFSKANRKEVSEGEEMIKRSCQVEKTKGLEMEEKVS